MKKADKLVDAIGMIDDRYVEEAHDKTKKKFHFNLNWGTFGKIAAAACALLLVINIFPVLFHSYSKKDSAAESSYYSYDSGGGSYYAAPSSSYYDGAAYEADYMEEAAYASEPSEAPAPSPNTQAKSEETDIRQNKKLILTANMNMETQDLDSVLDTLSAAVKKYGGYFQRSSVNTRNSSRYYEAAIRIPAEKYAEFLEEIKSSGNSTYYSEETKDITDSYTDIEARLTSLKAQEAKVLEFYDKAESIEDLMSVESRLSDIRYQIEYYESQIKNYDLLVAYSTLYLNITETKVYTPVSTNFFARLGRSFVNGWKDFIGGIGDFVIDITYNIWTILMLAALGYGAYRLYRFIRNRRNK